MCTHTPTLIGGKRAVDSTGNSKLEICSPQDPIVYHSCEISGSNYQHHGREALWDLIAVAAQTVMFRLWYRLTSRFRLAARCGWKISFSTLPPLSLAENWVKAGVWSYKDDGDGLGDRGNGDSRSDDSIYSGDSGIERLHLISSYFTTNHTLYHSHLLISLTLSEISWIHAIALILTAG